MKEEKALFSFGCAFKSLYVELQLKYSCQLDFTKLVPDSSVLVCAPGSYLLDGQRPGCCLHGQQTERPGHPDPG